MNELFEKIYAASNIETEESKQTELFEQIYKEAEMLNEMNPKLRALLAAGLIGTASLGAASCSMPTDDPYIPAIENPAPDDTDEENKETYMSAWKELGISEVDWNNIIAPATIVLPVRKTTGIDVATTFEDVGNSIENAKKYVAGSGFKNFVQNEDYLPAGVIYYQRGTFAYFIPGDQVQRFYAKGAKQPVAK